MECVRTLLGTTQAERQYCFTGAAFPGNPRVYRLVFGLRVLSPEHPLSICELTFLVNLLLRLYKRIMCQAPLIGLASDIRGIFAGKELSSLCQSVGPAACVEKLLERLLLVAATVFELQWVGSSIIGWVALEQAFCAAVNLQRSTLAPWKLGALRDEESWGAGHATSRFQEVLLGGGSKVLQQATELLGEGPKPLRFLCFLGGLVTFLTAGLACINIFSLLVEPSGYILQLYLVLFGLLTMTVEAKDIQPLERLRPFFFSWFRFLTVPGGKGCFYLFYGSLSLSLWRSSFFLALVGMYTASMGIVCILVHFGMRRELQQHGISVTERQTDEVALGRPIEPDMIAPPAF
ncbi:uncharacterized protein LOC113146632 [Cyclospora cayetanensis]|uniref:Uncharacterized protein LOC113146632 n=1 Tax=Cyclospora cayetanensis TaxID=88456 RepID=A0A6P6RRG5_9EIME|nr:uncharacterized protein LOC113146632 [Cyclospora cayetanensis]